MRGRSTHPFEDEVMQLGEARFLLAFNRWANAQILGAVEMLPPADFTRDLQSSFPSVRDTLVHVLWAEWLWLERCQGRSPMTVLDPLIFPTVDAIRTPWRSVEEGQFALLDQAGGAELGRVVTYTNRKGEEWRYSLKDVLRHLVNHSTFHRGQVVTMLRQLGTVPPATDLLVFADVGTPGQ
jgi:uncharacterized damage-inducible protein DinB